jgi:4-amino-4-deoxy-L-arabinose transferase-like glycosyltransferase
MATEAASTPHDGGMLANVSFYGRALLYGAFPYALVYPFAIASALRAEQSSRERARQWVICSFPLVVFLLFSIVGKRNPWYIVPAYPFLSVLAGCWLSRLSRRGVGLELRSPGLWAAAIVGALVVWISVDATTWSPLVKQAFRFKMQTHWRSFEGVPAFMGVALTSIGFAVMLWAAPRLVGVRSPRLLGVAVAVTLIGYASVRCLTPLARLDHASEIARLHERLSTALAVGHPIDYPVLVRGRYTALHALYYFGDDFEIVKESGQGREMWLYAKGDPSVRGISLNRERAMTSGSFR